MARVRHYTLYRGNDTPVQRIEIDEDDVTIEATIGTGPAVAASLRRLSVERAYRDLIRDIADTAGKVVFIHWIASGETSRGAGTAVLKRLLDKFDNELGVDTTFLQLSTARGIEGRDVDRRQRFFERLGFEVKPTFDAELPRKAMNRAPHLRRVNRHHLPGGRAQHMDPRDFDPFALAQGTEHELEHTTDRDIAQEIAMDHLAERPDYYVMLSKMERLNRSARFQPTQSQYVEFPRAIAEQVRKLRERLWAKHGTGGNPPTAWTGDDAYLAWSWWIALREGKTPPRSDMPAARRAYQILTGAPWTGPDSELFASVVDLWLAKREKYVTRHARDFQPGGTIAMIKWAAVFPWAEQQTPERGYSHMLETLSLVEHDGVVHEMNAMRMNSRRYRVR